jgi:hypothetical protein
VTTGVSGVHAGAARLLDSSARDGAPSSTETCRR